MTRAYVIEWWGYSENADRYLCVGEDVIDAENHQEAERWGKAQVFGVLEEAFMHDAKLDVEVCALDDRIAVQRRYARTVEAITKEHQRDQNNI
jgi:hypothetical protein